MFIWSRYSGRNCYKLFQFLYKGVPESQYLSRKFDVFNNFFNEEYPLKDLQELSDDKLSRRKRVSEAIKKYKIKKLYI